jgi:hypothetical protein
MIIVSLKRILIHVKLEKKKRAKEVKKYVVFWLPNTNQIASWCQKQSQPYHQLRHLNSHNLIGSKVSRFLEGLLNIIQNNCKFHDCAKNPLVLLNYNKVMHVKALTILSISS